jgi:hypothetical protein
LLFVIFIVFAFYILSISPPRLRPSLLAARCGLRATCDACDVRRRGQGWVLVLAWIGLEGRRRKIKLKATYTWQMINGVGRYFFKINFCDFFYGVFVRFSTRGVQKHHKKLFGGNTCQKLLAEKVEIFFLIPFVFTQRFCAFLNKGTSKTPENTFWGKYMSKTFGRKS